MASAKTNAAVRSDGAEKRVGEAADAKEASLPSLLPPLLAHAGPPLPLLIFGGRIQKKKKCRGVAANLAKKATNLGKKEQSLKSSAK